MEIQKSTSMEIKKQNRRNVMGFILKKGTTSRQEVAQSLQISMPTVLQNINELQQLGLIEETGQYESTGGRKASRIQCNADALYSVGIDITRNHVSLVLVDFTANILEHHRVALAYENTPAYYAQLGRLTQKLKKKDPAAFSRVIGAGVSLPGILDAAGKVLTDSHALGIRHIPCSVFQEHLPWPCFFKNDANAAGLAEIRSMPQDSTMVYLSLSNSVGGAVFFSGKLYKGVNQRCGEFGHMRLVPDGLPCYCGQNGCLDAYCSALRLEQAAEGKLSRFFECLQQGDLTCQAVWEDYLSKLAVAVVNLRMNFDCNLVLGGYVGAYLTPWMSQLKRMVAALDPFEATCDYLTSCRYQTEASAYGAALRPIDRFLDRL